ncbi:hypothetical protein ASD45_18215 [Pseudolabrys sp. Root1462]|jgi:outer membrane immunogenic protein|uniref:outer membrane protein n=1 Tax=Pseudolabrys sp. Root1462 TaxID=1736466 RepID=UPI000702AB7E|nr:outer membrane protein [Pseudolabrys sp. Root1462]KQY97928.1 hypothetical protein ASD45_18215 [Pseudolabrys sp. Root1462]
MRAIVALPFILIASAAAAADFPRQPAYVAPLTVQTTPVWSGFYLGGNVGGGWAKASSEFSTTGPVFGTANNPMSGVTGGVTLGYNWQSGPFVFGGETDFQYSGINGSLSTSCPAATCLVPVSASYDQKVHWFGTVRGRAGYAQDGWLIYATGGYAYARLETTATASAGGASASLSQNDNRNGWTVGGGIEVALTSHWSAKAEYLYMNFGSHTTTWPVPGLPSLTDNTKLDMNVVRAGVNYRF